jgi:hypothetical protein
MSCLICERVISSLLNRKMPNIRPACMETPEWWPTRNCDHRGEEGGDGGTTEMLSVIDCPNFGQVCPNQMVEDASDTQCWSQYCYLAEGGRWKIHSERPNRLFLLLRDIPCPSEFSTKEIDITILYNYPDGGAKLTNPRKPGTSFICRGVTPLRFFISCINLLAKICSQQSPS